MCSERVEIERAATEVPDARSAAAILPASSRVQNALRHGHGHCRERPLGVLGAIAPSSW